MKKWSAGVPTYAIILMKQKELSRRKHVLAEELYLLDKQAISIYYKHGADSPITKSVLSTSREVRIRISYLSSLISTQKHATEI